MPSSSAFDGRLNSTAVRALALEIAIEASGALSILCAMTNRPPLFEDCDNHVPVIVDCFGFGRSHNLLRQIKANRRPISWWRRGLLCFGL
jgi:hypothetical protein